ncbi:MAG: nucleotidyltransferase domain-containing protein, partial [Planctomycetota bacterium]
MDAEARRAFFGRALEAFRQAEIPFLVGGAYALRFFADVRRETKDLDVFIREKDWAAVRRLFEGLGYRTRLVSRFWLAKVTE